MDSTTPDAVDPLDPTAIATFIALLDAAISTSETFRYADLLERAGLPRTALEDWTLVPKIIAWDERRGFAPTEYARANFPRMDSV
ncbi:hypothetical protein [Agromyces humi]|uniref:hypothetical protein n=1 Tax=Agromyces humi TaxID=1766800 RepID=UPI001358B12A|nr:hypothetical protein [Agromyces humi]